MRNCIRSANPQCLRQEEHSHARNHQIRYDYSSLYRTVKPIVRPARSTSTRPTCSCSNCARSACARPTCVEESWSLRPDRCRVQTGRLCFKRGQDRCWHRGGLHPTDYGGHATTSAGHQAFAANRLAGCSGVQAAESELRNGPGEITTKRTTNNQTSGHVESHLGKSEPVRARERRCLALRRLGDVHGNAQIVIRLLGRIGTSNPKFRRYTDTMRPADSKSEK